MRLCGDEMSFRWWTGLGEKAIAQRHKDRRRGVGGGGVEAQKKSDGNVGGRN
jgi:hypothetical protein